MYISLSFSPSFLHIFHLSINSLLSRLADGIASVCPGAPDILWVIMGIVIGILLVGIALLFIWRFLTYIHDAREFQLFEKERANARWEGVSRSFFIVYTQCHSCISFCLCSLFISLPISFTIILFVKYIDCIIIS